MNGRSMKVHAPVLELGVPRGQVDCVRCPPILGLALVAVFQTAPLGAQADAGAGVPAFREPDFLLSVGAIVDTAGHQPFALVLGAEGELGIRDRSLTAADRVFVPSVVDGRPLRFDDAVQFFRLARRITDPATREAMGQLLVPTGVGRVDSLAGAVVRVRVTDAFLPILIGDGVRAVTETDTILPLPAATPGGAEGHVVAFQQDKAIHPPFDILFLRQSRPGVLAAGEIVLLYRPGPVADGRSLPDILLARGMVVRADGLVAAAVLTETYRSDLAVGDRYRREVTPIP
jgi:hypothetical protein